jgi:MFS family permease
LTRLRHALSSFTGFERDARVYLLTCAVFGVSQGLFWINFNLYLAALGIDPATIGLVATAGSLAGILVSFPASIAADRFGRRSTMVISGALVAAGLAGMLFAREPWLFFVLSALYGAGVQAFFVVEGPFLTEHSREDNRSELFAVQDALFSTTNVAAAVLGTVIAGWIANTAGVASDSPDVHRVLITVQLVLMLAALATVFLISRDRPIRATTAQASDTPRRASLRRVGIVIDDPGTFARLAIPGMITAVGAGQLIPFLNLFVARKFELDLATVNGVFAITSLGTVVAMLMQPLIARRLGKVRSIVLVQSVSIPFLAVLGFSPILATVVFAMVVRHSLMNASNPILNAFTMEQITPASRATMAATTSVLFSLGWTIGGPFYSLLQARLGFDTGYAVNFVVIVALYSIGTALFWVWFRDAEERSLPDVAVNPQQADARAATLPEP